MNYPDIHGLVLCSSHSQYSAFVRGHDLDYMRYKCMIAAHQALGYHIDSNPNTLVIVLDIGYLRTPIRQLLSEFELAGLIIGLESFEFKVPISVIVNVLRVPELKYLPKYLTHDDALVRTFAQRRFNELTGALPMHGNKFTNCNLRLEEDF